MSSEAIGFGTVDYCLFGLTLFLSAAIGLFFSCRGKKKDSPNEVFIGGRNMPVIPTALSLLTSFLSGVTLLAIPAEIYQRGVLFWFSRVVGSVTALAFAAFVILPIFFGFRPISVYQYFEERYRSHLLRHLGGILYNTFMAFYMAVVLYAPSVALTGVTGVPTWAFIISVGIVCIVYTAYGGLKAVVWADSLQALIMLGGVLALFFKGASDAGGVKRVFEISAEYGRWSVMGNIDPNPFQYMNLWTSIFGGITFWFSLLTFNQIALQRYLSLPTLADARKVVAINVPTYLLLITGADLLGIIMFAYFDGCDPLATGQVKTKDQLVIHFALNVFKTLPGMPGVFLACLFSGTLSTVSSGINSMAAVTWEDFFKARFTDVNPGRQATYVKLLAAVYGFMAIGLAFLAEPLGGIVKSLLSVMGATVGPLVGLFLLGLICPWSTRKGALVGLAVSFVLTLWISIGNSVYQPYAHYSLPFPPTRCNLTDNNSSILIYRNDPYSPLQGISKIYGLSDMLFSTMGVVLVLLFGGIASLFLKDQRQKVRISRLTVMSFKRKESRFPSKRRTYSNGEVDDGLLSGDPPRLRVVPVK